MQTDGPTQSNLPPYDPGLSREPAPATIPTQPPTWPQLHEGSAGGRGHGRLPFGDMYSLALGLSLFANVALIITLIGVLLFTHTGFFAPRGSSSGVSAPGSAVASPTATAAATSTPSTSGGWLQVTPSSVQLGCGGGQQTQFVVLANNGPKRVGWQADLSGAGDQAGVTVHPNSGDLRAGTTVTLQIQLNSDSGGQGQQGIIRFDPDTSDAGASPSLSYTTESCGG